MFEKVQSIDRHNLNADANLKHIYKEIGFWSEIQAVSLKQSQFATDERASDDKLRAICQAEQAFAIMFDCHVSIDELEKFNRAKTLFEQSEKQWQSFNETEKIQLKFWYAELLQRLLFKIKSDEDKVFNWKKGVRLLTDIISRYCTCCTRAVIEDCLLLKF